MAPGKVTAIYSFTQSVGQPVNEPANQSGVIRDIASCITREDSFHRLSYEPWQVWVISGTQCTGRDM